MFRLWHRYRIRHLLRRCHHNQRWQTQNLVKLYRDFPIQALAFYQPYHGLAHTVSVYHHPVMQLADRLSRASQVIGDRRYNPSKEQNNRQDVLLDDFLTDKDDVSVNIQSALAGLTRRYQVYYDHLQQLETDDQRQYYQRQFYYIESDLYHLMALWASWL